MRLYLAALFVLALPRQAASQDWPQHSMDRPRPPVVDPGRGALPVPPPNDAVVLFDGRSLDAWESTRGGAARWRVDGDAFVVMPGAGGIKSRQGFGDVQLHIEWMAPEPAAGTGQDRGNSGVFLMETYEVQVLDSYRNDTYPDGQAGSIYGQFPPAVNASRPPGEWQSYDIIFLAPRFDAGGRVTVPARMTVFHNGLLVQHDVVLLGPTSHRRRAPYEAHADRLPISLQDHGSPVRFRNIWVRELR